MTLKIEHLSESRLKDFVNYLQNLPQEAYSKDIALDEKDILSFRYYPGCRYVIALSQTNHKITERKEETIMGHLCIMTPSTKYGYHQEHIVEVHINVIPEFQKKGIGKTLLSFFIKEAKKGKEKSGIKKIKTKMLGGNEKVIKLFESFGFEKEAVMKKEWKLIVDDNKVKGNKESGEKKTTREKKTIGKKQAKRTVYEDCVYMSLML